MISLHVVFTWLNEFQGSSLTRPDTILRDLMRHKIMVRKFSEAYQVIEYLKSCEKNRVSGFERGEIWVEYGLAYYDMGNLMEAIASLKKAEIAYPAGNHEHAVALWMLGTMQWSFENEHAGALMNWKEAIEEFDLMERIAEQEENEEKRNWYCGRINEMEEELQQKIVGKFFFK